jgi:hypothetical protein
VRGGVVNSHSLRLLLNFIQWLMKKWPVLQKLLEMKFLMDLQAQIWASGSKNLETSLKNIVVKFAKIWGDCLLPVNVQQPSHILHFRLGNAKLKWTDE